jgi:hypothetical protein
MLRFLAVPATCLVLCVTAAAQDLHAQDLAALNTRLWKRAGPNGPLRRVAEATYALAAPA